jgi:uncharacterized protein YgbK (DUF1537 family)
MSRHPVTPMDEADLRLHLARQTERRIELIDMLQLRANEASIRVEALEGDDKPLVLIDVLDDETLAAAGQLVWARRGEGVFSASSSGLQYALAAYWRARGWLPATPSLPTAQPADVIAAVSGSCSPVTATQIAWARANSFHVERLDLRRALDAQTADAEIERVVSVSAQAISLGKSALVHSAEGPEDPAVIGFDAIAQAAGLARHDAARNVGRTLAEVMRKLLDRIEVKRVVVAGGDSSGEVASALGIDALSVAAGLAPGAPLCRAWSSQPRRDGLEIVLKGGQMGSAGFFGDVKEGRIV